MENPPFDPIPRVSDELQLPRRGVTAVLELVDGGATVPFIARYRKEATGGLDEVQIRAICDHRDKATELEKRRAVVLTSIGEQGKLTAGLEAKIRDCKTRAALENLYLPFKQKRKTRASIAVERGLEPLARQILAQRGGNPVAEAQRFVSAEKGVADAESALAGARDIVAQSIAEDPDLRERLREAVQRHGLLVSRARKEVLQPGKPRTKFEQYYDFAEPLRTVPSHRYLAVARGEREDVLRVSVDLDTEPSIGRALRSRRHDRQSPWAPQLEEAVRDAFKRLLLPSAYKAVRSALKELADESAVDVFANNLKSLLLAAPLGGRAVLGIDPGLRTGCKCAAISDTGSMLAHATVYPLRSAERAAKDLVGLVRTHRPYAVAIGNGTGGRETMALASKALKDAGLNEVVLVEVNEAGASVYSASDVARAEFPDLDLTIRGAISIARRLQDPLAELVKIEPRSIGVGQYQHDVHQPMLHKKLGEVVESCVNHVGVDLNTASAPLLGYVAGIGPKLAERIVAHRDQRGAFRRRKDLLAVSGLGARTFEQAAGFLRIRGGTEPLDASAVHPERYGLVQQMARDLGLGVVQLVGSAENARRIDLRRYIGGDVGEPTLRDIVAELEKPGRDPRESFEPPRRRDDVTELSDLKPGMTLEGVVTNVTHFGAFVDVGVHQDGLVHVSQLADRFVKDPAEVVRAGQRLTVRVLEVDLERRRISLTAKSGEPREKRPPAEPRDRPKKGQAPTRGKRTGPGSWEF